MSTVLLLLLFLCFRCCFSKKCITFVFVTAISVVFAFYATTIIALDIVFAITFVTTFAFAAVVICIGVSSVSFLAFLFAFAVAVVFTASLLLFLLW